MEIYEEKEPVKENHGTLYLTISVFLVILSFFILMNSISTANNQKTADITNSLKREFVDKKLKQEVEMFNQKKVEQDNTQKPLGFKDMVTTFLDTQKGNAETTISESPSNIILNIKMNSFFGLNTNDARPAAEAFIGSLNNYLNFAKKLPDATAKLVILYDEKQAGGLDIAAEKAASLNAILDYQAKRNISFAFAPMGKNSKPENLNNIYVLFDKNEF